jgi:hypothetical protein
LVTSAALNPSFIFSCPDLPNHTPDGPQKIACMGVYISYNWTGAIGNDDPVSTSPEKPTPEHIDAASPQGSWFVQI